MAYINQKTWNLISILFACSYGLFMSLPMVDMSQHAFLFGFYKAIPVWMSSILSMAGNDSMVGVALVFGSVGDILMDVRSADIFKNDQEIHAHLFKMTAATFCIQHLIIIYQFVQYWKTFRIWSLFSYFIAFNVMYFLILPNIAADLHTIVSVYCFVLTSTCFLAINGLSIGKTLKHERFNLYATVLFLFSDTLVIAEEFEIAQLLNLNPTMIHFVMMFTYYSAQILFANGSYNRYRYTRSLWKRK